ncbi:MAG: restriction endonuclease [Archaeoglobaceae archaeon]
MSWQEFEELVKGVFDSHDFHTKFRVVFKDERGKSEIDVVAQKFGLVIAIDAKKYSEWWHRSSALKRQAEKHLERCERYSQFTGEEVIPIIVSFIDDQIFDHWGCIVVPMEKLNDFLLNFYAYLDDLGYSGSKAKD